MQGYQASGVRVTFHGDESVDDYERTDNAPSPETEDLFSFLNRSARPDVEKIREELERWFATYPQGHRADLCGAFRSAREEQHLGAWWELYLYRLVTVLGFEIEVHPELHDVDARPDFEVSGPSGPFLLEAATTHAGIAKPRAAETREAWVIDALNSAPHPNFFVMLSFEEVGTSQPRKREITAPVTSWLNELDPDAMSGVAEYAVRTFSFGDGWRISLRVIPKPADARGVLEHEQLIGARSGGFGFVNEAERFLGKLRDKSGKYDHPGVPIVVAVNLISPFGLNAAETALFGTLGVQFQLNRPGSERTVRNQDGFWMRNGQPLGTRVSAVIEGPSISPWNVASTWPRLWLNPWAAHPVELDVPFRRGVGDQDGRVEYRDATTTPAALFGLEEGWPGTLT